MFLSRKWFLIVTSSVVLVYSIAVLVFILTTPDVGLRVLLADSGGQVDSAGLQLESSASMIAQGREAIPQVGDRLVELGNLPTHTFLDFASQFIWLRNAKPQDGPLAPGQDLLEATETYLNTSPFVEYSGGERWVKVRFTRSETNSTHVAYLLVQSLPLGDVLFSFAWFSLQLGFFLLCAFLCWNRPFDRAARVLFGLGLVALGAFIGGNHWWVMAAHLWLIVPCAVCGILLPAVFLHFFLVFPRPKPGLQQHRLPVLVGIYLVPALTVGGLLRFVVSASQLREPGDFTEQATLSSMLQELRSGIYGYFAVAALYVLLSLIAIWHSRRQTHLPKEQQQLRWIGIGSLFAFALIAASLLLAVINPVSFALGSGRFPMFLASLCFVGAFTGAVLRHRLMQFDQIVSRDMLYYVASLGLTGLISLSIALSILVPQGFNLRLSTQQSVTVAGVLTLMVILLLWLRDLFQQMIDRQFFRDRYGLDKALQKIQQSVAKLSDPEAIAELFLSSCRDVLGVDRGAIYLRTAREEPFRLMAFAGAGDAPAHLPLEETFLGTLKEQGSLQRIPPGSRSELSAEQSLLWELNVDLVHGLDTSEDVAGVVLLGRKRHAISFTSEDLTFLNALGQIANVAMHSAQVVDQNISRLNEELQLKLEKISEQQRQIALLQSQLTQLYEEPARPPSTKTFRRESCKGNSPKMRELLDMARKVAASESSVLIRGESGTGKEVLAQVLHDNSPRAGKPIIRVHCASLSPSLLESELFGHVKGAFTGAHQDRIGRFEAANGGTLFLDEIGDISLETQIKLLRVLQERCFEPVGSVRSVHVDVRLMTATHQNLEELIKAGRFREDLFYRLNVISMELPPLRERREDILELAVHFLHRGAKRAGKPLTHLDDEVLETFERYHWPGNVRELENVIERAIVMAEGTALTLHDLPAELIPAAASRRREPPRPAVPLLPVMASTSATVPKPAETPKRTKPRRKLAEVERQELQAALEECHGNKSQAAQLLGLPRSTFFSKLKRHGLS